jgi:hypothetical protein
MVQTPESVKLNAKGRPYNFQSIGQSPLLWAYQAQNLRRVADKAFELAKDDLKNNVIAWLRVDLIYKFLAGMALENLLKGIMIVDDADLVMKRSLSKDISHHKIWTTYADSRLRAVKQQLTQKQRMFLEQIELYSWLGRYGVGTNETDYVQGILAVNDPNALKSLDEFRSAFNEVFYKLYRILTEKSASDWEAEDEKARADLLAKLSQE